MGRFIRELARLLFSSREEIERKAAEFKAQREKRAAEFAAKTKEAEAGTPGGGEGSRFAEAAGELLERLGLGTKAQARELAARLGRRFAGLFK